MLQASLWGPGAQGQGRGGEEDAIDQGAELGLLSHRTAQAPRSAGETLLPPPPPPALLWSPPKPKPVVVLANTRGLILGALCQQGHVAVPACGSEEGRGFPWHAPAEQQS